MCVIATRSERCAIISKVKFALCGGESVNVKPISVHVGREIVGADKENCRRVACFSANFKQALDYFYRCEASYRVSVGCHDFQRLSFLWNCEMLFLGHL